MTEYTVTYQSGRQIAVELPGHPNRHVVLAAAAELEDVREPAVTITRDAGKPNEMVVWRMLDHPRSLATVELPEDEPESFRLFVTFAYEIVGTVHTPNRPAFGNTMLDIDFEPSEPEHIESLQAQIAAHTNIDRVIILGWQRVRKP